MSRRKKNYAVTDNDQTYEEILDENLPDEDDDEEEIEVKEKKPKKKWSRKKVTVGILAGLSAIGAAFLGGMATENRRKKRPKDDVSIYNFDNATIMTDDPEIKGLIEADMAKSAEEVEA